MFYLAAIGMGLAGSLHCVGMCGPIAMALPYRASTRTATLGNILLYNLGRVFTYSMMGLLLGLAGRGLFLAGLQNYFSIAIGLGLLLAALFSVNLETSFSRLPFMRTAGARVRERLGYLLKAGSPGKLFGIGALNGLLPCGMVYMAVLGALGAASMLGGMLFMALFGLGTIPLMAITALGGHMISLRTRAYLRKAMPFLLVFFAILFILRGFEVGLPDAGHSNRGMDAMPMCD